MASRNWIPGWVALICVYFFWGSTYIAIRIGDASWPPFLIAASRYLIAGAVIYPLAKMTSDRDDHLNWRYWRSAAVVGI
jgi:drug/metabolite transporter (DMT)-like permease